MPEWLWYAAFGCNLGSALAWWVAMRRERQRWQRWHQRETEQMLRWAHVERCSACTAWLNEENARLAESALDEMS